MSSIPKPTDDYPDSMIEAGLDAYKNKDRGSPADTERYCAHAYLAFPKALRALQAARKEIKRYRATLETLGSCYECGVDLIDHNGRCTKEGE